MKSDLLENLNPAQSQAVTHPSGNLMILAGAGSGKTRVLVHRIAWLLQNDTSTANILAVTFTNKAANEMRNRLEEMLQLPVTQMWVGTFHGLAHRLLRLHWQEAGLPQSFQIIDADDQLRILKRIHKSFNLDTEKWPPKKSQAFINSSKEKGLRTKKMEQGNMVDETLVKIYRAYEEVCTNSGLLDFSELLLRSYELWQQQPELRQHYQKRFRHILIDEFQDTNAIQYAWVKMLTSPESSLTVVGDDDQSIYSWRGADSGNMKRLSKEYHDVKIVRLEQNYRSTATILNAANAVIAYNNNRLGKKLWTSRTDGELITLYAAFNEIDEARYIVNQIHKWLDHGNKLSEVAILYRSNAQSRVIEEQLLYANMAYRIYGGLKFFERAEIKDALAYLRFIANQDDDAAFERIINLPARGIGEATLTVLRSYAKANSCSLWKALQGLQAAKQLPSRAATSLNNFVQLINNCIEQIGKLELQELVHFVINTTNLKLHYAKDLKERQQSRLENLDELITAAKQFAVAFDEADYKMLLNSFLAYTALEAGEEAKEGSDCVQLMTLHAAKGLEFPLVFLCGLEDGLFPHIMSMETKDKLEEERRLCYVGMTRAMQKLYLLYAESRQLHGSISFRRPSRFLQEIPQEFIDNDSVVTTVQPVSMFDDDLSVGSLGDDSCGFNLGQRVMHNTFGEGSVIGFEGQGDSLLVQIKFKKFGSKWLSPKYAQLEIV